MWLVVLRMLQWLGDYWLFRERGGRNLIRAPAFIPPPVQHPPPNYRIVKYAKHNGYHMWCKHMFLPLTLQYIFLRIFYERPRKTVVNLWSIFPRLFLHISLFVFSSFWVITIFVFCLSVFVVVCVFGGEQSWFEKEFFVTRPVAGRKSCQNLVEKCERVLYLSKLEIVFVQIGNCIRRNWKLYLSKLPNVMSKLEIVFVKIKKEVFVTQPVACRKSCICSNCRLYFSILKIVFVKIENNICWNRKNKFSNPTCRRQEGRAAKRNVKELEEKNTMSLSDQN